VRVYQSFILTFVSEPHSSNPLKVAVKLFSLSMDFKVHCMTCSVSGMFLRKFTHELEMGIQKKPPIKVHKQTHQATKVTPLSSLAF
jgi:hypothetical protein